MSASDELLKLKELLDAGVLTNEEFQAEKTKILEGGLSQPPVSQPVAPAPPPAPPPPMPPTYMFGAVFTTLFCCLPLGIAAIINASQVSGHYHAGRYAEALRASESSKNFGNGAVVIWIVLFGLYFLAGFLGVGLLGDFPF